MVEIVELEKIKRILQNINPIQIIEDGFIAYSQGEVVVPPVGEMIFDNPPGECHIKYGYIKDDDYYVIKVASGFYDNPKLGYLTNVRTATAGAIAAKYMAPSKVNRIGIFGAGVHGRMQPIYLQKVLDCKNIITWGINQEELEIYEKDMKNLGFNVQTTQNPEDITSTCNLIVTCTPSKEPLILADQIQKGTHITAIGSDTPEKQELDSEILKNADKLVVDSIEQCLERGESYKAIDYKREDG